MHPFRYHVFACDQKKLEGVPSCAAKGSQAVIDALRREVASRNLLDTVAVTACGSIGLCEHGPNLVVYPEGVWYSHVSPEDVPEIVAEHFQNGRPVARLARHDEAALKRDIAENRGKAMAMLRARDQAGALPEELDEMARGFMASRVLLTAIELDVFTHIARAGGGASSASHVAGATHTDLRAMETLLNALVALRLLSKQNGRFANAPLASRFLVADAPDAANTALRHHLSLWRTWSTLTEVVRSGRVLPHPPMDDRGEDWTVPFIAAMHRNAAQRAPAVVQAVGPEAVRRLIDIGGGSGAYAIAFATANPALEAEIVDLRTVLPIAERHIAEAGLTGRVRTRVGDLRTDTFGSGHDLALLSAICHMLGPDENRDLLRRVFASLAPGGRVVVQDFVMDPDKTSPRAGALFAINMLVGTPLGSTYTESEYAAWLEEAGFNGVRRLRLPGPTGLIVANRG